VLQLTMDLGAPIGCGGGGDDAPKSMAPMLSHGYGLGDKMVHV
jgi:hypothetical protein